MKSFNRHTFTMFRKCDLNDNRFCKATAGPNRAGISMDDQSRSAGTVSVRGVLSESERTLRQSGGSIPPSSLGDDLG